MDLNFVSSKNPSMSSILEFLLCILLIFRIALAAEQKYEVRYDMKKEGEIERERDRERERETERQREREPTIYM